MDWCWTLLLCWLCCSCLDDSRMAQLKIQALMHDTSELLADGEYEEALGTQTQLERVCVDRLGPQSPVTIAARLLRADIYRALGDLEDSRQLLEELLRAARRVSGEESAEVCMVMYSLGKTLREMGEIERAVDVFHKALSLSGRTLEAEHPLIRVLEEELARAPGRGTGRMNGEQAR